MYVILFHSSDQYVFSLLILLILNLLVALMEPLLLTYQTPSFSSLPTIVVYFRGKQTFISY